MLNDGNFEKYRVKTPLKNSKSILKEYHESRQNYVRRYPKFFCILMVIAIMLIMNLLSKQKEKKKNSLSNTTNHDSQHFMQLFCSQKCNDIERAVMKTIYELMKMKTQNPQSLQQKTKIYAEDISYTTEVIWPIIEEKGSPESLLQDNKLQKIRLKGLQQHKMTSPRKMGILGTFWNFFLPQFHDYSNLNSIFEINNTFIWESQGNMLCAYSGQSYFKPLLLQLKVPQDYLTDLNLLWFGISIDENLLTIQKKLSHQLLGRYKVKNGRSYYSCDNFQCQGRYVMMLIILKPMKVVQLGLYIRPL